VARFLSTLTVVLLAILAGGTCLGQDVKEQLTINTGTWCIAFSPDGTLLATACTFRHLLISGDEPDHAAPQALDFSRQYPSCCSCLKFGVQAVAA
jgi:hypothetical protein